MSDRKTYPPVPRPDARRHAAPAWRDPRVVAMREIENPYGIDRAKQAAAVNVREHPLEWLYQRRRIGEAQKKAGDRLRNLFETAGMAGACSLDFTVEPVDGGGRADAFSERRMQAGRELKDVARVTGKLGYRVLSLVCGEGRSLEEVAKGWPAGDSEQNRRKALGFLLREQLSELAAHWGYSTGKRLHPFR
ncbi:MAG: DUF6456 domain-containing protein [Flavobacteriaceae bacterium]